MDTATPKRDGISSRTRAKTGQEKLTISVATGGVEETAEKSPQGTPAGKTEELEVPEGATRQVAKLKRSASILSRKSVQLQQKTAECEHKNQELAIRMEKLQLQRKIRHAQSELDIVTMEQRDAKVALGNATNPPEEILKLEKDLARQFHKWSTEIELGQEEMAILDFKMSSLHTTYEKKRLEIDENSGDDDPSDASSDDGENSYHTTPYTPDRVQKWVDLTQQEPKPTPVASSSSSDVSNIITALTTAISGLQGSSEKVILKSSVDKDLPHFSGKPEDWLAFKNEFERTTQKNRFENSENLVRLRKCLHGKAKEAVQYLLSNPENVPSILLELESEFGQSSHIIRSLIKRVEDSKPPDLNKPDVTIEFCRNISTLVTTVKSFNDEDYLNNKFLLEKIVQKMPSSFQEKYFTWIHNENGKPKNLSSFHEWILKQKSVALEMRKDMTTTSNHDDEKKQKPKRGPGAVHVASGEQEHREITCPLCSKSHLLYKCDEFAKLTLDQRWDVVKKGRLCICCFLRGHQTKDCRRKRKCGIDGCFYSHHQLLHSPKGRENNKNPEVRADVEDGVNTYIKLEGKTAIVKGCDGPLPIVPVTIKGPKGAYNTYALLDTGATRSLITAELAEKAGLEGRDYPFRFRTANGSIVTEEDAKLVNADLKGQFETAKYYCLKDAVTVSQLKIRPYSINMKLIRSKWPHLQRVNAKNICDAVPEIVVGNNNPFFILPREAPKFGPPDAPVGWRTPLGWTVSGNVSDVNQCATFNYIGGDDITNEDLHTLMKSSFSTENFGVVPLQRRGNNILEERAYGILESTTKKLANKWETGLLWKEDIVDLPSSYDMAWKRLMSTERKMKNPGFAKLYCDKMDEYLRKGFIRKLDPAEVSSATIGKEWYLPHFGVTNPNKPGKFRLVFDAAAKSDGVSLNDALIKGPDLIRPLVSVLWNFRIHSVVLTGDIADMFHCVSVSQEDRAAQRFLWRNGDTSNEPDVYEMTVLIFGATSSPCSAIYAKNRNAERFKQQYPKAWRAIVEDHYVDDCMTGDKTEEEVISLRKQISEISESGNFVTKKFASNRKAVVDSIPEDLRADGFLSLSNMDKTPIERVLGLWWDPCNDNFVFKLVLHKVSKEVMDGARPTKRQMCSLVMSLYDPLGFINHFKIKGIMLLQRTWQAGIDWDDEITSDIYASWKVWLSQLKDIEKMALKRCYSDNLHQAEDVVLHVFVDASSEAFAAVAYLVTTVNGNVDVSFVGSKARVAPLKKVTIPRMELLAALLGSRLANTIQLELKVKLNRRVFWSDSKTVLSWIKSEAGTFKEFVANRVGEIQECTEANEWKWVPTDLNVADIATRFEGEISFLPDDVWFCGPEFLQQSKDDWPKEKVKNVEAAVINAVEVEKVLPVVVKVKENLENDFSVPPITRFSSYTRLLHATAAVERAWQFWKGRTFKKTDVTTVLKDIHSAERKLVKLVQRQAFGDCLADQKKGKLAKLSPVLKDGILCVKTRIQNADLPELSKFPMILPAKHHFTDLVIMAEHERSAHQGRETVLNNLRRKFWIVDGRQAVLRVTRACGHCRIRRSRPLTPEMGNLPSYRLAAYRPAFTFTGVDLAGPFEVTVGRHHEKRWIALFTCLVTRGIHLEVCHGLSTMETLMALTRFVSTRGRPTVLHSDNGTNFVGASKEVDIPWSFIPPAAPNFGGAWESLVKSVKKCLNALLHQQFPKESTFLTVVKETEGIINSRPITFVSNDPTDPVALTPNHFLRNSYYEGEAVPVLTEIGANDLRNQWGRTQYLLNGFWKAWTRDFLPKMMLRDKWIHPTEPLKVGDLVLIIADNQPRNTWIRGYVSIIHPGNDGQVRVVSVTTKKNGSVKIFKRLVSRVVPLGLRMEIQEDELPKSGAGMMKSVKKTDEEGKAVDASNRE